MSTIEFSFRREDGLPPLAWLAVIDNSLPEIFVFHGKYVETREQFFVEGVWAGEFAQADLDKSDCVFGTGGRISDGRVTFVSSTATTDYLYYYKTEPKQFVSNSLLLILSYANDRLDPKSVEYAQIIDSIALARLIHDAEDFFGTGAMQ